MPSPSTKELVTQQPESISGSAHAKVNLGLEILRKRPDGYHNIATVFCPIALSDEITCSRSESGITLTVEGIQVPADPTNLCARAAEILLQHADAPVGARITLRKHIPVGAGLGGGSSDAATVLRLLNVLWDIHVPNEELLEYAGRLGADVPYFLRGGLCYASGIGEKLEQLKVQFPYWIVVVVPPETISTAWAYDRIQPRGTDVSELRNRFSTAIQDLSALETLLTNDFEEVVLPAHPAVGAAMRMLQDAGLRCVRMSGSGSAVYGLSSSETTARHAAAHFSAPFTVSLTPPILR